MPLGLWELVCPLTVVGFSLLGIPTILLTRPRPSGGASLVADNSTTKQLALVYTGPVEVRDSADIFIAKSCLILLFSLASFGKN